MKRKSTPTKKSNGNKKKDKTEGLNKKNLVKSANTALKEIRALQRSTHLLIPKAPFLRLVKKISFFKFHSNFNDSLRLKK
jgi:hypothetical protein